MISFTLRLKLMAVLLLSFSNSAQAQDHDGPGGHTGEGGGGAIVCRNERKKIIGTPEMFDRWEARTIYKKPIPTQEGKNYVEKVKKMIERFKFLSPYRHQLYGKWFETFDQEKTVIAGGSFKIIKDALYIGIPKGCAYEQVAIQRKPELPGEFRYSINGDLWDRMDDDGKAALVFHELIYREAMIYGHENSRYVRHFHRKLFLKYENANPAVMMALAQEAHFEESDYPVTEHVKSELVDRSWSPPKPYTMEGDILFRVGRCIDEACEKYESTVAGSQIWEMEFQQQTFLVPVYLGPSTQALIFYQQRWGDQWEKGERYEFPQPVVAMHFRFNYTFDRPKDPPRGFSFLGPKGSVKATSYDTSKNTVVTIDPKLEPNLISEEHPFVRIPTKRLAVGAGLIVCRDLRGRVTQTPELVDEWEAKNAYHTSWTYPSGALTRKRIFDANDATAIFLDLLAPMKSLSPTRERTYENTFYDLFNEKSHLPRIQLETTTDTAPVGIPEGCGYEQLTYYRTPEFKDEPAYFVDQSLWDLIDDKARISAALHTAVAIEALSYGHENSRYVNFWVRSWMDDQNPVHSNPSAFMKMLLNAHFEQTDLALFEWNPFVVEIGKCAGIGCKNFRTLLTPSQLEHPEDLNQKWIYSALYRDSHQGEEAQKDIERRTLVFHQQGNLTVLIVKPGALTLSIRTLNEGQSPLDEYTFEGEPGSFVVSFLQEYSFIKIIEQTATRLVIQSLRR